MNRSTKSLLSRLLPGAAILLASAAQFHAVAATLPSHFAGAQDLGLVAAGKTMTATVHLPMADRAGFEKALIARYTPGNPLFRQWMSKAELASYGPKAADIATVKKALAGFGLQVGRTSASGSSITVVGDVSSLHRAFGTQIHAMLRGGDTVLANTAMLRPQGALAGRVSGVSGLSGGTMHTMHVAPTDASGKRFAGIPVPAAGADATAPLAGFSNQCFGSGSVQLSSATTQASYSGVTYAFNGLVCAYTPAQIAAHYGLSQAYQYGVDGTGQTIVIVDAYGSPTALADANSFFAATGIKPFDSSNFSIITPAGAPTSVNYGWAGETALDIELAHAIAPGAKIVLAVAPDNHDTSLQAVVQYVIDNHIGNVVSNSYGEGETESDSDTIDGWDQLGKEASAVGITLNFSTGDDGDYSAALGHTDVSSPSDSPWVTAVGGTSIDVPSKNGPVETGWGNYRSVLGTTSAPNPAPVQQGFYAGGGGGESAFLPKPSWQSDLPGTGRQQPDLGLIADPYTGAVIVEPVSATSPSVFTSIGGTSLAAPVFSAMWALVNQAAGFDKTTGQFHAGSSFGLPAPLYAAFGNQALSDAVGIAATQQLTGSITTGGTTTSLDGFQALGIAKSTDALTTLRRRADGSFSALSFNTDTSLTTTAGFDTTTGRGVPSGPGTVALALKLIFGN
jgi:subtilase family serine protease